MQANQLASYACMRYGICMRNTQGGVKLRDWLREERRTQKWLGEQIGTHQTNVSRWILGHEPPLGMALALEQVTGIEPFTWLVPVEEESSPPETDDAALHAREDESEHGSGRGCTS